jgi:ATP-dependent Clp protease adaptor protein ClpS
MSQLATNVETKIRINETLAEPPLFKVIYLNDNQTTMEFVVESLIEFFNYTTESAEVITLDIHKEGAATVATLPFELAEQKGIEVTMAARQQNYPLQIKLEPNL